MNRERAKELLPIIQAFADGKIIQARATESAGWNSYDKGAETGFLDDFEYRIKPEPREWYIALHDARPPSVHEIDTTDLIAGIKIVHVREVMDND